MWKKLVVVVGIIVALMIGLNIFIYSSHSDTASTLKENNANQDQVAKIDDFRTYVVDMGHMQKLYILMKDDKYKTEYESHLNNTYIKIDELNNAKYISDVNKVEMENILNSYRDININIFSKLETIKDYKEIEDSILESNKIQISLLHEASVAIAAVNDSSQEQNSGAVVSINVQNKIIQVISTVITALTAVPLYYYKKKYNKDNIEVTDIVDSIIESKHKEEKVKESNDTTTISKEELKEFRERLVEHSLMLSYANLLAKHNENMKTQWKESEDILKQIENNLNILQGKLDKICKDCDTGSNMDLHEFKLQLFQLKLLFQQLPQYHQLVIELTNNMLNISTNKEL